MNLTSLTPLAVILPILGAALTFMLIRHPKAQQAVSISLLSLTLLLEVSLLAQVWNGGTVAVRLGDGCRPSGWCWWWISSPHSCWWFPRRSGSPC